MRSPSITSDSNQSSCRDALPFTLQDLRNAIPEDLFVPSLSRSLAFLARDLAIIALLYAIAFYLDSWLFVPFFWLMQGTMFWALFVVGHDCGHQSFSRSRWINDVIGHLCHTPILVPYHGWRISHRTHHANTGNIDTDESWYPVSASTYQQMSWAEKLVRFHLLLLAYPVYLFKRSPNRQGSHFLPSSPLFRPAEKHAVITSTVMCSLMVLGLAFMIYQWGWLFFVKYYFGPYVIFVMWLDLVTFLHHTEPDIPWYRGDDWYFLKGALSTIDRDYGWINWIHHDIGTHVVHHIFSTIPHYHLQAASEAIKPILGQYHRTTQEPIWYSFWQSSRKCHFVPDQGSPVYYQPPHKS